MDRPYYDWFVWLTIDEIAALLYDVSDADYDRHLDFYRRAVAARVSDWEDTERTHARRGRRAVRPAPFSPAASVVKAPTPPPVPPVPPGLWLQTGLRETALASGIRRAEPGLMYHLRPYTPGREPLAGKPPGRSRPPTRPAPTGWTTTRPVKGLGRR